MALMKEQNEALDAINEWLKSDRWEFVLGGYAGTGKTFLLQHLINTSDREPICCAPTGKAASVLSRKLKGKEVTTIHHALYVPIGHSDSREHDRIAALLLEDPSNKKLQAQLEAEKKKYHKNFRLRFGDKEEPTIGVGQLVIVDEASMVTNKMHDDFQKTGCKAIFVGDPGQLPPVKEKPKDNELVIDRWFSNDSFDYVLETVHRQALDSPIIQLSMEIRTNAPISKKAYHDQFADCRILQEGELDNLDWILADQIITGRNDTRHELNRRMRENLDLLGSMPLEGEKLICLKNEGGLYTNGVQCKSLSAAEIDLTRKNGYRIDIDYDGEIRNSVLFYDWHCRANYPPIHQAELPKYRNGLRELDYGYAITAHKAQGSEWDSVIIYDDELRFKGQPNFRRQWMYTAVTRAKKKLIWVKPEKSIRR